LGDKFTCSVDHLPSSITHLYLGHRFNQPVDHLPSSLTHLFLGSSFNHPMNYLPSTLTHLIFASTVSPYSPTLSSSKFNQPLDKLPLSLQYLEIGRSNFKQCMKGDFPLSITIVEVGGEPDPIVPAQKLVSLYEKCKQVFKNVFW
jgi:hypothetical protein